MKRLNYLMNGLAALALIVLFAQCAGNTDKQTTSAPAQAGGLSEMKIAYVEIDTLLAKYNYCIDLNEAMVKKGENVRLTLNQKASELEKQKQEMKRKIRNHLIQVLSASEIPQGILFLEALPKNESGKVRKRDLI